MSSPTPLTVLQADTMSDAVIKSAAAILRMLFLRLCDGGITCRLANAGSRSLFPYLEAQPGGNPEIASSEWNEILGKGCRSTCSYIEDVVC